MVVKKSRPSDRVGAEMTSAGIGTCQRMRPVAPASAVSMWPGPLWLLCDVKTRPFAAAGCAIMGSPR